MVAEAEEDVEEEDDEEDELQRVSTPVLVIFSFLRFASGALSTLFRKKPSLLPRLKAWQGAEGGHIEFMQSCIFSTQPNVIHDAPTL